MKRWIAIGLSIWLSLAAIGWAQTTASTWRAADRIETGSPVQLPPVAPDAPPQPAVKLGLPRIAATQDAIASVPRGELAKPIEAPPDESPVQEAVVPARIVPPKSAAELTPVGFNDAPFEPVRSNRPPSASPYDPPPPFAPSDTGYSQPGPYAPSPATDNRSSAEAFFQGRPRASESSRTSLDRESGVSSSNFGERFGEGFTDFCDNLGRRGWITSDRCFSYFATPVTNPFLAEDPRAVSEIRPIFMFQSIPNENASFRGGNAEWFGTQLRIAFSDQLSFTINKFGAIAINPGNGAPEPGGFGFSEVHLGPKFTFWRDEDMRLIGAAGLLFQIPAGRASVYQDTGSLSLVPYLTVGKNFLPTGFGSFNVINTTGYSFGTDRFRTDFFYNSLHLDFDWMDRHRIYPLLELNWFAYTNSGQQRFLGTEGADLANIGSTGVGGKHNLLIAAGFRFKFSERNQVGIATEFPIISRRDMNNFRLTIDYIWRY
jgi:hypothetical protein